jgi:mono/diheme cytochrome c family protein
LLVGLVAATTPVPWPGGKAPSPTELDEEIVAADDLYARERAEEFLEAAERGEDSEHIYVSQADIDAGTYDLARLFRFGDAIFEHEFRPSDGLGASADARLQRVQAGVRGGLDTFSCAACHSVGGPDGAGAATQNAFVEGDGRHITTANVRNPPHVLGLGFVQALGVEMTGDLTRARDAAIADATSSGAAVTVALESKGIAFGSLTARPDGTVDTAEVAGVDADLVVRPFGWKGEVARLRRFVETAARIHFGIQAHTLAIADQTTPDPAHLGNGPWYDPDADGKQRELEEGALTATAVYLTLLEVPQILPPFDSGLRDRWARGSSTFDAIGCGGCHTRTLPLSSPSWTEAPDTTGGPGVIVNLVNDGDLPRSSLVVELFSDLKRHDMGPALADATDSESGVPRSVFLTRPLWGLAETAPFLHDGRAPTIRAAVEAHGGEGSEARDAFMALSEDDKRDLDVFLHSLTRAPHLRVPR